MSNDKIEKIGIMCSVIGTTVMTIFGLVMAHYTKSEAIFLDGMFNFMSTIVTLITFAVVTLVNRGFSERHPVGYYAYEVFMIFIKGIFILGLVLMSVYNNIHVLLSGGREPNTIGMLWYAIPGVVINLATLLACYIAYKKNPTGLLLAEYKDWKINTLLTVSIVVALIVVLNLKGTSWEWIERYVDQILVITMCVLTIGDPIYLVVSSFKEMMLRGTKDKNLELLLSNDEYFAKHFALEGLSVVKLGRGYWIFVDVERVGEDITLSEYLEVKKHITSIVDNLYPNNDVAIEIK